MAENGTDGFHPFNMNTFTNKEWGEGPEDPKLFNYKKLDAEQWVKSIKDAGFKEILLTCKHHDGFCLWPTKTTERSAKSSNWKNGKGDVVKEVLEACRKYNIAFEVYLSPWERKSKFYGADDYNNFFIELLTQYETVTEVWFDGACCEGPNGKKQIYDYACWYVPIRKLQPQTVIAIMGPDVRWVGTELGRGGKTE